MVDLDDVMIFAVSPMENNRFIGVLKDKNFILSYLTKNTCEGILLNLSNNSVLRLIKNKATNQYEETKQQPNIRNKYRLKFVKKDMYWVGDTVDTYTFGYGRFYKGSNILVYEGFSFFNVYAGIGISFHEDGIKKHYEGTWYFGKSHGYGTLWDQDGNVTFQGYFNNGLPVENRTLCILHGDENLNSIHAFVTELVIGCRCFVSSVEQIDFMSFPFLVVLEIGNESFQKTKHLKISNNPSLESIQVGEKSFNVSGSILITNNSELHTILIAADSFVTYSDVTIQSIFIVQSVIRSSLS